MSDVAYRDETPQEKPDAVVQLGNVSAAQEQAREQLGMEDERPHTLDQLAQGFGEERHSEDTWIKAAVKAQNRLREKQGGIDDHGALIQVKAPPGRESYKNPKEAAADVSFTRKFMDAAPLIQQGVHPDLATHIVQQPEPPPTQPGMVDDRGNRFEPIGPKLQPEDRQITLREGVRFTGNARELDARAAEEQWVQQRQAQEQRAALEAHQRALAAQQQPHRPQVQQPQPQAQQQPHPVVQHLANLERSLQIEREVLRRSPQEQKELDYQGRCIAWERHNAAANQKALSDPDKYPQRYKDIQQNRTGYAASVQRSRAAENARLVKENTFRQQASAYYGQQWNAYKNAEDEKFSRAAPEMNDPGKARDLRNDVQKTLRASGFADQEIDNAWGGKLGPVSQVMRDHRVQLLIRKAALYDRMQARAQNIPAHRQRIPSAQGPGFPINRGAERDDAAIARIQRQLETATGTRASKLGLELQNLYRAGRSPWR